jgi:O-acetyl-ADP-ribose deacetylase (regulator of RNase III)
MEDLEADALVQSTSARGSKNYIYIANWAKEADNGGVISKSLMRHKPFKLGVVIVVSAGELRAKYLFSAIVIDRVEELRSGVALDDKVISDTAKKCIRIAASLGLESIAFTPWGTRAAGGEAARITAIMLNAIVQAINEYSGNLRFAYLVSNNTEHYKWFIDRSFVVKMFTTQVDQVKSTVSNLQIPADQKLHIEQMLNNITNNITMYNQSAGGDLINTGNISDSTAAVGQDARVDITQK